MKLGKNNFSSRILFLVQIGVVFQVARSNRTDTRTELKNILLKIFKI